MKPFYLQKGGIFIVPVLHYRMELAAMVRLAFQEIKPDCIAVELPETMHLQLMHAASRLPDISVVKSDDSLFIMCEPCDASFEGLRSALETNIPAYCIDLDVKGYPDIAEPVPDSYALMRIGHEQFFKLYNQHSRMKNQLDEQREQYMAKRLKELSFSHDRIMMVTGMAHAEAIAHYLSASRFPEFRHAARTGIELCTLTEKSCQECMSENAWITSHYELMRETSPPDRQQLLLDLYKMASENYKEPFPGYHLRNLMKFSRNYALITGNLLPDTYQILTAAKGCVDHNYAYEVWKLATIYDHLKNIDRLPELDLKPEEIWGASMRVFFHLKEKSRKSSFFDRHRKDKSKFKFQPPGPFMICSYPPEDIVVEKFGDFLRKKGTQILTEEAARTIPFSSSIEDGLDMRETIRHWHEKKLYVKSNGKPPGGVGSVVMIFDEDMPEEGKPYHEKYTWYTTWMGEHNQESDMAFYATSMGEAIVGPGISKCEYGGFMMSYPPRRMYNIWQDPDYEGCISKSEVLLAAAIDYAVKPLVVYVASKPPRQMLKSFARRFGKKVVYIPMGQLSPITTNRLRTFHVLDGKDKRDIADEYIF